ncbi:oligopeptide transporter 4-like [Corylus avellana]|uniref:oligopeptide transporter 4-like n=1 Tax=Corylus avellana TaxID=13451 RepID=UPI00286C8C80|nr:oligopeptide transporter 4-like [Corylus avellana]
MGALDIRTPAPTADPEKHIPSADEDVDEEELSPVEEVRLTVANTDDPSLPIWTFRMWFLGLISCALLSFLNQFFAYRTEPLIITQITVQVASLPVGRFMASVLPETKFRVPGFGSRTFSLNPGPFNMKEHVLISIFANAGSAFGFGSAYAVGIVTIIKAFYHRKISFLAGWLLITTTQVYGYGWAGLLRKYVVESANMWWPGTLVQVSLFRALHEREKEQRMSRAKFFLIAVICSFSWYLFPGYLFTTLTNISWVCWVFSKSVTAQQIGSGMRGLEVGAVTLDWAAVSSFLFSPLIGPFFSIVNIFAGYILIVYIAIPTAYWGFDLYNASRFPIYSSDLFTAVGQKYNISAIVNDKFELNQATYTDQGRIHLSMFFPLTYGFGFATIASTLTHVLLFYGREIYERYHALYRGKEDIHTKLMRRYKDIPSWWFYLLLAVTLAVSFVLCIFLNDQIQMPWWGLLFAGTMNFTFTLPISIITATTNQTPGLNVITEYAMGLIYPGRPIANVCFKTYGYMSMAQAVSFLSDFKLGHYMKIPPRSMFLVQFIGTLGNYAAMNWFFLGGAIGPVIVWLLHKTFPGQSWIPLISLPVLLGSVGMMPPATPLNYNAWIIVGTFFNFYIFRYRKQ